MAFALLSAACTGSQQACGASCASSPATRTPLATASAAAAATPAPAPRYPSYYIESLRNRTYAGGPISVGPEMFRGPGYTKSAVAWVSGGQTMTGTISIPDGSGPFPVVIVNHGHIPVSRYWIGQDSGIFGDPMASHGFISIAPNYPGYAGSGPGEPGVPAIIATTITVLDLVSSLRSLPSADPKHVAMIGHSNGGGVSLLVMAIDRRVGAFALFAPVSSDMTDNARKWWLQSGAQAPMGPPESDPDGYRHISPRSYFEKTKAPVLFIQGTLDEDIPADWTNKTVEALQASGVSTRVMWIPGAHHDLVGADLDAGTGAAEAWIRQGLGLG